MEEGFRSRGIRIMKDSFSSQSRGVFTSKIYYEAKTSLLKQTQLQKYIEEDLLSYFEHSVDINGNIDTFNFHVNLNKKSNCLYKNIPIELENVIKNISNIFDESFSNYTIGYRIRNNFIIDKTFYFYPTIIKEKRIGINGIVEKNIIKQYINSFINYLNINNVVVKNEIQEFAGLMYKFKGIGITIFQNNKIEYKIYGKIYSDDIYKYLKNKVTFDSKQCNKYGEVILVSQRINNKEISGYNLYYSK